MTRAPHACRAASHAIFLLLCLLTLDAAASAQTPAPSPSPSPPAQPPPASAATRQPAPTIPDLPTRLNVIVTDESGRSVADVKPEEISVKEDGQQQTVTRFAPEELPVSYGLVIDNSRSLASMLDSIIRAGELLASRNRPGDETFVLRFVDSDKITIVQDFTADSESVRDALAGLYAEGGNTAVVDALVLAVRHTAEHTTAATGRRAALVLISDCEDRASVYKQEELIKLLRQTHVQVFVIALPGQMQESPARARKLAETVAAESGGRAFLLKRNSAAEIQAAVDEIARNLRTQYALEYRPTHAAPDGKFRQIEVKAAGKRKVHARSGYYGNSIAPAPLPPAKK